MRKSTIILSTLFLLTAARMEVRSQSQAVSKTFTKTVVPATRDIFAVVGEKALIQVKGWDKNQIEIKIIFSAEHNDKAIATRELEYMHYSVTREKNQIELRNAFILPARTDRIQSRVQVEMQVTVPATMSLSIANRYGDTEISGTRGKLAAVLEFNDLTLNNVSGEVKIESSFSEIRGDGITVTHFTSRDEESKYALALAGGSYVFNSRHSDIDLTLAAIQSLIIEAAHTDVTVRPAEASAYNYQLTSKAGKIFMPPRFASLIKKEGNQSKVSLIQNQGNALLQVTTTFNTITIQ